ncbi:oxaloacetate decarboxylase [Methylocapsa sp. S129]|uniref:isocitrate lyase/PEP mutase family protein n=1 Tax=Methylocapsa sp. S129 TaxID=1641869 RepID=UPI00131B31DD|nr:isocitrate lyase/phosphoenolpyruvate mutase family protein [Methylocapsa sp. S129]
MTNDSHAPSARARDGRPLRPASLKPRIAQSHIIVAPGVYDALTASLAAAAGFEALYLSGAAIAYTKLGQPDIGLVSMTEVADTLAHICERVETPVIVDADTGYGNALNVQRTVRLFERAGAAAIQIEDQTFPKRCGHLADKGVVPMLEMVGKIRAAVDARRSDETLVIARTDALAVEGFEAAVERAESYAEAGADILFVEAPRTREQLSVVAQALGPYAPLMANMVEGGQTPILSGPDLQAIGFRLVIFPGAIVRALAFTAQDFYGVLRRDGTTDGFRNRMFDFQAINEIVGTPAMLERGKGYEEDYQAPSKAAR